MLLPPVPGDEVRVEAVDVDEIPRHLPDRRGPREADAVGDREAADVAVGEAVDGEVGGVAGRADAGARDRLVEGVGPDAAAGLADVAVLDRHHEAEPVTPALAHLLAVGEAAVGAGAARDADRDAVAHLVRDDAVVEVTVALGARGVPEVHLDAGDAAVGRAEVAGVVDVAAVLPFGAEGVAPLAAVAEVVLLEVAADLIEPVLIEDVVDEVIPVEQVRHRGRAVGAGLHREVEVEVEDEVLAAVRRVVRAVGAAAAAGVDVGPGVVPARRGVLRGAGIVPAHRRGYGVGRVGDERALAEVRALERAVEDAVGAASAETAGASTRREGERSVRFHRGEGGEVRGFGAGGHAPVVVYDLVPLQQHLAGGGVDADGPDVVFLFDLDIPCEDGVLHLDRVVDELGRDRRERGTAAGEDGGAGGTVSAALHRERLGEAQAEVAHGGGDSVLGRKRGRGRPLGGPECGDERTPGQEYRTVLLHVDGDPSVGHFDASPNLLEVDVGDAATRARVRIGHDGLIERRARDAETVGVLFEVLTGRLDLGALSPRGHGEYERNEKQEQAVHRTRVEGEEDAIEGHCVAPKACTERPGKQPESFTTCFIYHARAMPRPQI